MVKWCTCKRIALRVALNVIGILSTQMRAAELGELPRDLAAHALICHFHGMGGNVQTISFETNSANNNTFLMQICITFPIDLTATDDPLNVSTSHHFGSRTECQ